MKMTTAYAIAWIAVSVAVTAAIIITERLIPLWAFIIPGTISFTSSNDDKKSEGEHL